MKLHHLRHFDAIARHSSLHGAARTLGIAQSALSRSLSELERSLGVVLVVRSARGVTLTVAGERFLLRARSVQAEIRRGLDEAAQSAGVQMGTVTVGMSPSAQLLLIPNALQRFRREWPGVRLTIIEGLAETLEPQLLDGTLDFYAGACGLKPHHSGLQRTSLLDVERVVVCRPGHPAAGATSLKELEHEDWIQIGYTEGGEQDLDVIFAATGTSEPKPVAVAPTMLTAMLLLHASDTLALMPRIWVDASLLAGAIIPLAIRETLARMPLCLLRKPSVPLTPAAQTLYESAMLLSVDA